MDFYTGRIYYLPAPDDGTEFLVDGIWPRGIRKEQTRLPPLFAARDPLHNNAAAHTEYLLSASTSD